MKIKKIDGNDLLKHMMFWAEKTDDDCIEIATTDGVLDIEMISKIHDKLTRLN